MLFKRFTSSAILLVASVASVAYGLAGLGNFAIARPFSLHDASGLGASFDDWSTYPPCSDGAAIGQPKLFLVYSQSFENDNAAIAESAIESVQVHFNRTKGWGNCFAEVVSLAVNITPDEDLYRKDQQDSNVLWVNGPNRQFERTARALKAQGIDLFYLMEMDSVPIRENWLDTLVEAIQNQSTAFAILGSKYRGDNWDNFYSTLPSSLLNHINGNAIYNLTNGFFWLLVEQLESEANHVENSVAFDYRIAQILDEAEFGIRPPFPPSFLSTHPTTDVSDAIKESVEEIRASILETPVIGNYATTNMVKSYLNDAEVIIHGAMMRGTWDKNVLGNVSLLVSDWHEGNARHLLASLDQCSHPFVEVVVLADNVTHPSELMNLTSLPVQVVSRHNRSDRFDLCTAPISTEWFMKTNSFHRIRNKLEIMTETINGMMNPVVPFISANNESCTAFPSCTREIAFARMIDQDAHEVFQTNQFVFHTNSRNDFCEFLDTQFSTSTSNKTFPSATAYVAFLERHLSESLYVPYYKGRGGFRDLFVRLPASIVPLPLNFTTNSTNSTNFTNSTMIGTNFTNSSDTCIHFTSQDECLTSRCEWRDTYGSCRFSWTIEITSSPSVSPSAELSEDPTLFVDPTDVDPRLDPPSDAPSMQPDELESSSPTIVPTTKGVRSAPVTTVAPTVEDPSELSNQSGVGGTARPVWIEAVTGTILGVAAMLFVLMMFKRTRNPPSETLGAETSSNPDVDFVDSNQEDVVVGDIDEDSVQGFSSVSSDLYQTYLSEVGHINEADDVSDLFEC